MARETRKLHTVAVRTARQANNDDNDGDDGDSDDDGQEQSTRLPSELLGKQNWRLPTNKKTLHGTLPSELLVRQRRQTHVTGHGTRRRVTTDTLDASYRQQLSKTLFRPCISSS